MAFPIPTTPGPRDRSYWVVEGRLAGGAYPGRRRSTVEAILSAGITAFINLTEDLTPGSVDDHLDHYDDHVAGRAVVERYPIPDLHVPDERQMIEILDAIDRLLADGRAVYVHCWGGIGRTGTAVGCWLVRHGHVAPGDAVDLIAKLRRRDAGNYLRSPETDEQRRFIEAWEPGK